MSFKRLIPLQFKKNSLQVNLVISLIVLLIIFTVFNQTLFNGLYDYEIGNTIKEDIVLQRDVVDQAATQKRLQEATEKVSPVMYIDISKQVESKKNINDFFDRLEKIQLNYQNDQELLQKLYPAVEEKNQYQLSLEALSTLALLSADKINVMRNYAVDITTQNMTNGITQEELQSIQQSASDYVFSIDELSETNQQILNDIIAHALVANEFIDQEKTNERIENAKADVEEVKYTKGSILAEKGEVLTADQYALLKAGDMLIHSRKDKMITSSGIFIYLLILWLIAHIYIWQYDRSLLYSIKKYAVLIFIFLTVMLSSRFFYNVSVYLIPIPLFVILTGLLIDNKTALPFGIVLVAMVYLWHNLSTSVTIIYLMTVFFASTFSVEVKQRFKVMSNCLYVSILMIILVAVDTFIFKKPYDQLLTKDAYIVLNGIICALISIGSMPFFEGVFKILTPFKLQELSNPNHKLLKRLLIETPGTYHHSIMVGNLAEAAAHEIGANSLLTRVGAFYHDIGKLERPYYFKENQVSQENPHDKLPPQVSANIIKSHVSDGIKLAEKYKLPVEIKEIIASHHGTTLIKFFYYQEKQKNENLNIEDFIYEGPLPSSKEMVIVMLADSVEAAVRSMEHPSKEEIESLVDKIIYDKIVENQFVLSNITLKELNLVKESFLKVLSGIFHQRITYPEIDLQAVQDEIKQTENISLQESENEKGEPDDH